MILVLDTLLAVCFFLTVMDGVRNGFFREGFTLAGLLVGLWAAIEFSDTIQQRLPAFLKHVQAVGVVLFVVICLVVVLALRLTGHAFAAMWEGQKPSPPSRVIGLILGSIRGLALVLVLAAGLTLIFPPGSSFLGKSLLLPYLSPGIVWGADVLPRELGDRILWRWGQLPFKERTIIPGRDVRGNAPEKTADRDEPGTSESPYAAEVGGITAKWPFAS